MLGCEYMLARKSNKYTQVGIPIPACKLCEGITICACNLQIAASEGATRLKQMKILHARNILIISMILFKFSYIHVLQ